MCIHCTAKRQEEVRGGRKKRTKKSAANTGRESARACLAVSLHVNMHDCVCVCVCVRARALLGAVEEGANEIECKWSPLSLFWTTCLC
mmetsp:Transcript_2601/g.5388  ORF Transcript_2601/g.5388 Transcript_2601/m.5388 type:complete len:88 (+) Transcript_2601:152-415(+)